MLTRRPADDLHGVTKPDAAPVDREHPYSSKAQGRKAMRMLLRVSIPVETGNAAAKAGTLGPTIEKILADLKPEAAYFFADDNGNRSGSIVFDLKDSSQIPAVAEPWFLAPFSGARCRQTRRKAYSARSQCHSSRRRHAAPAKISAMSARTAPLTYPWSRASDWRRPAIASRLPISARAPCSQPPCAPRPTAAPGDRKSST